MSSDNFSCLNTSVDDLRSTLHHVTDAAYLRELLAACSEDKISMRKVIETRLRKVAGKNALAVSVTPSALMLADKEMGAQLTMQYHRATGGMREVIKLGAMMMMLEAHLLGVEGSKLQDGVKKLPRGKNSTGGVKAWLKEHAPEVKEATAYRFKDVAESVAQQYAKIVGPKTANELTLPVLVMTPTEDLPLPARKKQEELFTFVDGTSQRSWLDKFKAPPSKGGNRGGGGTERKDALTVAEEIWTPIIKDLELEGLHEKSWAHLPDKTLAKLKGLLIDLNRLLPTK